MAMLKDVIVTGSARILGTLNAKKVKATNLEGSLPGSNVIEDTTHRFLTDNCKQIGNWNEATSNGFWMAYDAANAPTGGWYFGFTIVHHPGWVRQEVYPFTASSDPMAIARYVRYNRDGTWTGWVNELFSASITLSSGSWSGSPPYTQTIGISGVTAGMDLMPTLNISGQSSATVKAAKKAFSMIDEGITNNGSVTFKCYNKKPTVNIPLYLRCI